MTINQHLARFAGRRVEDYDPRRGLTRPAEVAHALRLDYEEGESSLVDKIGALAGEAQAAQIGALVIGCWQDAYDESSAKVIRALADQRDVFTGLRAIFVGDIYFEECEISWIIQSDLSPLLIAYPNLEVLAARGGTELALSHGHHGRLESLTLQSGGLEAGLIQQLGRANLPALEHLELWLGTPDYGGTAHIAELMPILSGRLFPNLRSLALKNAVIADELARALVGSPVIHQIDTLDLSMGTLSDEGAEILGTCEPIARLKRLDVSRNYLSAAMVQNLKSVSHNVVASDQGDPDDEWRYCSISE